MRNIIGVTSGNVLKWSFSDKENTNAYWMEFVVSPNSSSLAKC